MHYERRSGRLYPRRSIGTKNKKKPIRPSNIELKKTTDILKVLGERKRKDQVLAGFALETNDEEQNAIEKLHKKNLDFIVLNSLNDEGAGFKTDTNKITIIDRNLNKTSFGLKNKHEVARDICSKLVELINL